MATRIGLWTILSAYPMREALLCTKDMGSGRRLSTTADYPSIPGQKHGIGGLKCDAKGDRSHDIGPDAPPRSGLPPCNVVTHKLQRPHLPVGPCHHACGRQVPCIWPSIPCNMALGAEFKTNTDN